ncbi:YebC/PmpR family DNA-binding transcriptional regulator [Candidatus Woesebacteria bacterium]|nr:YebC/PmpR family DNA-binding transcriptional regulator [Candidatus Woesebacteria bacterium]
MSGHSHWATTKRAKEVKDIARGKVFSKLGRTISIAAKAGGDADSNARLRVAIEAARAVNMPKENIERAIARGARADVTLQEVTYEGFGPGGIGVIVEVATDNRNRTSQEIKNIFERCGGSLCGPGSVAFNFDPKGFLVVERAPKFDKQMLSLIDLGVEDVQEFGETLEVYVTPSEVANIKEKIEKLGYKVKSVELVRKPKNYLFLSDYNLAKKTLTLLESLEDHDDVQKVFTNADIPADLSL